MALDGVCVKYIENELTTLLLGGRIDKIYQPEKEEIIINIRSLGSNYKLLLTASPQNPRIHITNIQKENPMQAPLFCMVLRKHLTGAKITDIKQVKFERILEMTLESSTEMGDLAVKKLIIEIMGKHSNVILTDSDDLILDSAKRITFETSTVREVLPGKKYVYPPDQNKLNPLEFDKNLFIKFMEEKNEKLQVFLFGKYSGISPLLATALAFEANLPFDANTFDLTLEEKNNMANCFSNFIDTVKKGEFKPSIVFENDKPFDFTSVSLKYFDSFKHESYDQISKTLEAFYQKKDLNYRMAQKTTDMRKLISKKIEKCYKKKDLHLKMLADVSDRDTNKLYGELLTANIYSIEKGAKSFETQNYYDENLPIVKIKLDENLSASENAQKYFKKYNKEKRTYVATLEQMAQNDEEISYLESVLQSIELCFLEADIENLREELYLQGFVKKKKKKGQKPQKSKPMHFVSSDGFDIYVGKNNIQNDELTLKFAENSDMWFHTKDIPGSHVIVKSNGTKIPEETLNEAAMLAAYFSKGKNSSHVPVDFTLKKFVKKPSGAKPGMVIYEKNQTAYMTPNEDFIKRLLII